MPCATETVITLKHGEIKTLKFTYTKDGGSLDITAATMTLQLKENFSDVTPALEVVNANITKTGNVAEAIIDTASLTAGVKYLGEMKAIISAGVDDDRTDTFFVDVVESVVA
jgi:hypothetical protein